MRHPRKTAGFVSIFVLLATFAILGPPAHAAPKLAYSIKEARAYAEKASLDKTVVELAPKCDPEDDPKYKCDEGQWNHKPNCPDKIEIGPDGKVQDPKPAPDVTETRGGAGEEVGGENAPPQSSPIRYNRFVAIGSLSRLPGLEEARGLASRVYVDLSGRSEPEAHTESEAYGTQRRWEERCFPEDAAKTGEDYTHLLSRSDRHFGTYHFSQCHKRDCFEQAPGPGTFGADAEKATSIVDLKEEDGEVVGELSSVVEDLNYGGGALTIDSVETYIQFQSDGTPQGLKWSVSSTANGAKLGGQPITLPPGQMVSGPGFSVGMAAPYVSAEKDGSKLTIVAAGLTLGSDQQAAFLAGAEVVAGFGEDLGGGFTPLPPPTDTGTGGSGGVGVGGGGGSGFDSPVGGIGSVGGIGDLGVSDSTGDDLSAPVAAGEPGEVLVYEMPTGIGTLPGIVALGIIAWFLLMSRWLQRFAWGRRLSRKQPFRSIDWVYRAFIKT